MTSVDARAPERDAGADGADRPAWHLLLAGLLVVLALAAGLFLGRSTAGGVPRVVDPVDIGFAQDMKVHHAQAVQMSGVLHRRTSDLEVQALAFDVMTTQQGQIGIMSGWLDLWGHTQTTTGPTMAWMGHDGPMPGMAEADQIASLETLPEGQLEEEFLRLMVRHHLGAVPMAAFATDRATSPDLARLAGGMASGQAAEIELMQDMLVSRGHDPEPAAGHGTHG
ncbi:DUF305 domain-containing protein [soil metagenome]